MGTPVQTPACGFTSFTYYLTETTLGSINWATYGITVSATTPPTLTISTAAAPVTYNMHWYATTTDAC